MGSPDIPPTPMLPPPPDLFDLAAINARSENRRKNMALTGFRSTFSGGKGLDIAGETPAARSGYQDPGYTVGPSGEPSRTRPAPARGTDPYANDPVMGTGQTPWMDDRSMPPTGARTVPAPPRLGGSTSSLTPALALAVRNLKKPQALPPSVLGRG